MSELKILCDGVGNFERMCEAAKWTHMVEIYMERDEEYADDLNDEQGWNGPNNNEERRDDGRYKILSQQVICDMFIDELRNDPLLKPVVMQNKIHEKYNVVPSHNQCRKAKKKALELIEEEYNEKYRRMKDYRDELKA